MSETLSGLLRALVGGGDVLPPKERGIPLASLVMGNPVGTESVQSMSAADPSFQPGVEWGKMGMVSRPMYDMAQGAVNNAMGWGGPAVGSTVPKPIPAAFRSWFGASKVANPEGMPLQVYHGTNAPNFEQFDPTKAGGKTGNVTTPLGHFFTDNPKEASRYATSWAEDGGNVRPSYLSLQNPYEMPHKEFDDLAMSVFRGQKTEAEAMAASKALQKRLIDQGYDGITVPGSRARPTEYVVFDPQQAKSAIEIDAAAAGK